MIIPVRCFTCGKVVGHMLGRYNDLKEAGMNDVDVYKTLGLRRICCKRMLMTCVSASDQMSCYTELPDKVTRTTNVDKIRIVRAR